MLVGLPREVGCHLVGGLSRGVLVIGQRVDRIGTQGPQYEAVGLNVLGEEIAHWFRESH
jgi:hypothetical protein